MKNILCYGDSNTWGADPLWDRQGVSQRIPGDQRWTGVLQRELGEGYRVYECGLNNRTTAFEDTIVPDCNGLKTLPVVLNMTRPLDLVIIMLGTNDVKRRFCLGPADSAKAMEALVDCVRRSDCGYAPGKPPKILIVAPAPLIEAVLDKEWGEYFGVGGIEMSRKLASYYRLLAEKLDCAFADASEFACVHPQDGVHLDSENHRRLAGGLLPIVRALME